MAALAVCFACSDPLKPLSGSAIEQGETVMFTTLLPDIRQGTKSAEDDWKTELTAYKPVGQAYTFNIEMWKQGALEKFGDSNYQPVAAGESYSEDGTLQNVENPLYWQDNVNKWGFKATAGTVNLETDQSEQAKWLAQDRLVGYSYLPIWDSMRDAETDNINAINFRTSKEWYADNKVAKDLSGLMVESNDDYKKIPLYFQHQRAWLTIILKAGEGVTREALAFSQSATNIVTRIYSYQNSDSLGIDKAWAREELIHYDEDKNGPEADNVSTTRYDAIVEPHNFLDPASIEKDILARISVSNQKFTFAAANDLNYANYLTGDAAAIEAMQAYNLTAGKHLTITATLSRASRLILITAWIEDWTETVTQTICDDYGQNGDPILIHDRDELIRFLSGEDNVAGNVGLVVPNAIDLTRDEYEWDCSGYDLKATLNLAGAELTINSQFLNTIERTGSVINGSFMVKDEFSAPVAVATTNKGTIERVNIVTSGELSPARASVAGFVNTNYGTIYQCNSALTVHALSGDYIGGIAAKSLRDTESGVDPVLDACTVTARVDGDHNAITASGGIVGQAEGRVSNNTFEYGVTMSQNGSKFFNIIGALGIHSLSNHTNNSWPTTASYRIGDVTINNNYPGAHYDAVIDRMEELKLLLTAANNQNTKTYRVANSFDVDKEHWIWEGAVLKDSYFVENVDDNHSHGCVKFKLNGNDKTITLTGTTNATMLFGSIIGQIYDLNLLLDKPIVAKRIISNLAGHDDSNSDAIAAFAYAVSTEGSIANISLKANKTNEVYIESTTPAGIAVWAKSGGKLTNCVSNVPIRMHVTSAGTDARRYAGGIVAEVQKAVITQCKYYGGAGSIGWAPGVDAAKAQTSNCRYGGIVGGTTEIVNSGMNPNLVLTDCFSWWELPTSRPTAVMGSLIGSTVYHEGDRLVNAMAVDNAGNWWTGLVGAGLWVSTETQEKVIGKKNSVQPTKPKGW